MNRQLWLKFDFPVAPYTLVIVDMQACFPAACAGRPITACRGEIIKAMRVSAPIVLVEYKKKWPTIPGLTNLCLGYPLVRTVTKYHDDGSLPIKRALIKNHFPQHKLRICGVNASYCVKETIRGLRCLLPTAEIIAVANAINCVGDKIKDSAAHRRFVLAEVRQYGVTVANPTKLIRGTF